MRFKRLILCGLAFAIATPAQADFVLPKAQKQPRAKKVKPPPKVVRPVYVAEPVEAPGICGQTRVCDFNPALIVEDIRRAGVGASLRYLPSGAAVITAGTDKDRWNVNFAPCAGPNLCRVMSIRADWRTPPAQASGLCAIWNGQRQPSDEQLRCVNVTPGVHDPARLFVLENAVVLTGKAPGLRPDEVGATLRSWMSQIASAPGFVSTYQGKTIVR